MTIGTDKEGEFRIAKVAISVAKLLQVPTGTQNKKACNL
jgi:hypothetical protein